MAEIIERTRNKQSDNVVLDIGVLQIRVEVNKITVDGE
jgi:hypothetical protein